MAKEINNKNVWEYLNSTYRARNEKLRKEAKQDPVDEAYGTFRTSKMRLRRRLFKKGYTELDLEKGYRQYKKDERKRRDKIR